MGERRETVLTWLGLPTEFDFAKARPLGRLLGWGGMLLYVALVLTLALGLLAVLVTIFGHQVGGDGTGIEYRWTLLTVATLTATLGAAIALPLTILRTRYTLRQTVAAEQGLITDRINKAVEGLGAEKVVKQIIERPTYLTEGNGPFGPDYVEDKDGKYVQAKHSDGTPMVEREVLERTEPNIEVRVGAILSLERISENSPEDHVRIMEILCAYVRENACIVPITERPAGDADWKQRTDTQMALSVLGRRRPDRIAREDAAGYRLDLRGANLQRADMSQGAWARALMQDAKLGQANLGYANLQEADLWGANLQEAYLWGANLQGAYLRGANLQEAYLRGAVLKSADLRNWSIGRTFLRSADFTDSTGLTQEAVNSAFGVASGIGRTILPDGIEPPDHWHVAADAEEDSSSHAQAAAKAYEVWLATLPPEDD